LLKSVAISVKDSKAFAAAAGIVVFGIGAAEDVALGGHGSDQNGQKNEGDNEWK